MWTDTRAPVRQPRPSGLVLPFKHPPVIDPSCVLALLPQWDDKWVDYSGQGNHGIVHGATPTAKGPHGFAYEFDGVNDWVTVGNVGAIGDFTIAIPFYSTAVEDHRNIFHTHFPITGLDNSGVRVEQNTGGLTLVGVSADNTWRENTITTALAANRRYQLVIVRTGNTLLAYLDRLIRLNVTHISWPPDFPRLTIGRGFAAVPERAFAGIIASVCIYNRAWSPNPADPNYLPEIDPVLQGFIPQP